MLETRRREFITLLGGAMVGWHRAAHAQAATPVIGYLNGASAAQFTHLLAAFRQGLSETGYAEGRNVAIEYHYADGHYGRLPALGLGEAASWCADRAGSAATWRTVRRRPNRSPFRFQLI